MEISVRVLEHCGPGVRWHYCVARNSDVGIEVEGASRDVTIFCPLCGALSTSDFTDVRPKPTIVGKLEPYDGLRCPHGYPDAPCSDLLLEHPEFAYDYRCCVPEYRAFLLASEPGRFDALRQWARPCAICRSRIVSERYGVLEHELTLLCSKVTTASDRTQRQVRELDSALRLIHSLRVELRKHEDELRLEAGETPLGYIYAISNRYAIKIGWSWGHPGTPGGPLGQLQTACPDDLSLLGAILGAKSDERALHSKFSEQHIRGEWFRQVPEIVEYFVKQ